MSIRKLLLLISTILTTTVLLYADIFVCNSCGFELNESDNFCANCGTRKGGTIADMPEPIDEIHHEDHAHEATSEEEYGYSDEQIITLKELLASDLKKAQSISNPFLKILYLKNALVVSSLDENITTDSQIQRIKKLIDETTSDNKISYVSKKCITCQGTGLFAYGSTTPDLNQLDKPPTKCKTCKGLKQISTVCTRQERATKINNATNLFNTDKQNDNLIIVLGAWLPNFCSAQNLSISQRQKIAKIMAPNCKNCLGSGIVDCKNCNNTRIIKCPNTNCKNGVIIRPKNNSDKIKRIENQQLNMICPTCKGKAFIACPECHGKGALQCTKCSGTGAAPVCITCEGDGYQVCPYCKNKTSTKSICKHCNDTKFILCRDCNGTTVNQ